MEEADLISLLSVADNWVEKFAVVTSYGFIGKERYSFPLFP